MKTSWTFTHCYVVAGDSIYVACAADVYEDFARHTHLYQWDPELQRDSHGSSPWFYKQVDWRATALTALIPEEGDDWWLCALSEEGDVLFTGGGYTSEKIPGAGVFSEGAKLWGYVADLQQIGEHLYVCGYRGQVYKRFGPNDWRHVDDGLLQAPAPETPMAEAIALSAINGPHESAIYAVGYQHCEGLPPRAFYWDGLTWRLIELPGNAERLTNLYIESEQRIWLCGSNGSLLLGNAQEGFKNLSTAQDNQLFTSVCRYREKIYLGSNLGLFVYDPKRHQDGIQPVVTGMKPELQDANIVDAYENVLWSIGPKDIARFDGAKWQRIHHPDNPKIGA